jgi:hypothetical protein
MRQQWSMGKRVGRIQATRKREKRTRRFQKLSAYSAVHPQCRSSIGRSPLPEAPLSWKADHFDPSMLCHGHGHSQRSTATSVAGMAWHTCTVQLAWGSVGGMASCPKDSSASCILSTSWPRSLGCYYLRHFWICQRCDFTLIGAAAKGLVRCVGGAELLATATPFIG